MSPQVLKAVAKELTRLSSASLDGIKVHINDDDMTDIQATITGLPEQKGGEKKEKEERIINK